MQDLYQRITDRIVQAIEAGTPPWIKPWREQDSGLDANLLSGKPYRGINLLLLYAESLSRGFTSNRWLTLKQANQLGARVNKGERGTGIVFFKWKEVKNEADEAAAGDSGGGSDPSSRVITSSDPSASALSQSGARVIPLLRSYTVFNLDQVSGLPEQYLTPPDPPLWQPCEMAESLLMASAASITHGGNSACYLPELDRIELPHAHQFETAEDYYATALHELTHWTGHPSRCNRVLGRQHVLEAYAFEELVAEMGSAFLTAHCALPGRLQHASYIDSWLSALRHDKRLIFVAASKAQAAADYVLQCEATSTPRVGMQATS